jgi:hypothetical protein
MKDMMKEKVVILAKAQQSMADITDRFEEWDNSQLIVEKSAFTAMNVSDTILNLSKEGNCLVETLRNYYGERHIGAEAEDIRKITALLKDVQGLFHDILVNANEANDTAHDLEIEIARQSAIEEGIKMSIDLVNEGLDSAAACAEFMLAEF